MTKKAGGKATASQEADLVLPPDDGSAFGPAFFLRQLVGFVRARCPDLAEQLPIVEIALHDGSQLVLCHVLGLAPRWVALAAYERSMSSRGQAMYTEFVPYGSIVRVTIRVARAGETRLGFSQPGPPTTVRPASGSTPEAMLRAAGTVAAAEHHARTSDEPPSSTGSRGSAPRAPSGGPGRKLRRKRA